MKAVIVGGGIGGLAAALAFRRIGWEAEVLERAAAITEVGAGIQISPNGFKVLAGLGLADEARRIGFQPEAIQMRLARSDRLIFTQPVKSVAERRWGAPYLQAHRADLIDVLHQAALRAGVTIRLQETVETIEQRADGAAACTDAGAAFAGDVVIGADGLRSTVRTALLGPEAPRFTGAVAWRAVAPVSKLGGLVPPQGACVWTAPGRHVVTYPLRGGAEVNFVGVVEQDGWREESWTAEGDKAEAHRLFGGWRPLIDALIEQADRINRWALFDRQALPRWTGGRVALLGDACHPMPPSLAQGAVQALEDAWILPALLEEMPPEAALPAYFARRIDRATRVQQGAHFNMRVFHRRGAAARAMTYAPMWLASTFAPWILHRRMDWLYGEDVTAG